MNSSNAWKGKLEVPSFLPSKNLDRQVYIESWQRVSFTKFPASQPDIWQYINYIFQAFMYCKQLNFSELRLTTCAVWEWYFVSKIVLIY